MSLDEGGRGAQESVRRRVDEGGRGSVRSRVHVVGDVVDRSKVGHGGQGRREEGKKKEKERRWRVEGRGKGGRGRGSKREMTRTRSKSPIRQPSPPSSLISIYRRQARWSEHAPLRLPSSRRSRFFTSTSSSRHGRLVLYNRPSDSLNFNSQSSLEADYLSSFKRSTARMLFCCQDILKGDL